MAGSGGVWFTFRQPLGYALLDRLEGLLQLKGPESPHKDHVLENGARSTTLKHSYQWRLMDYSTSKEEWILTQSVKVGMIVPDMID